MFCKNCGNKLGEGDLFCLNCGTAVNAAAPPSVAPGVYSAPATPAAQVRAKKLSPVIIGVAAAALVVAVAVTVFVLNALKPWQSSGDALSDAGGKTPSGQADVSEVETLLVLGQEHLSAGEYDEAITAFTSAIALDGELTEAYVGRGDAYAGLARYGDAAADYERALELDDSDKSVATKLGAAQNTVRRDFVAGNLHNSAQALSALQSVSSGIMEDYAFSASVSADAPRGYLAQLYYELIGESVPEEFSSIFDILGASTVRGTLTTDAGSRLIGLDGAWQVSARDILTASAVLSEDSLYFTIPELFPTAVELPVYSYEASELFSALFDGDFGGNNMNTVLGMLSDLPLDAMLEDAIDAAVAELTFGEEKGVAVSINGGDVKLDAITLELTQTDILNAGIAALTVIRDNGEYVKALVPIVNASVGYEVTEAEVRDALDELLAELENEKSYADDGAAFTVKLLANGAGGFSGVVVESENYPADTAGIAWKLGTGYELWASSEDEFDFRLYGDLTLSGLSVSGTVNIDYDDGYESISGKLFSFSGVSASGGSVTVEFSDLAALNISSTDSHYSTLGELREFVDSDAFDYLADASLTLTLESDGNKASSSVTFRLGDSAKLVLAFSGEPRDASLLVPSDIGYSYYDFDEFLADLDEEDMIAAFDVVSARLAEQGYDINALWSALMFGY